MPPDPPSRLAYPFESRFNLRCLLRSIAQLWKLLLRPQGPVSRKPRKLFGPVKPLQNLEPCDYRAVLFAYSKDEGRFPSYKKFQAYTLLRFKMYVSKNGFTGPKTFRGFRETGPSSEIRTPIKRLHCVHGTLRIC